MDEDLRQSIKDVTQELRKSLKDVADTLKPDTSSIAETSNFQQVVAPPEIVNTHSSITEVKPTPIPSDLTGIHASIEGIKKELGPILRKYGVQPPSGTNAQLNYETVRALALKARDQKIVANRSDVNDVGKSLMDVALCSRSSSAATKAWSAAVELVNYASFLNQSSSSVVDLVNEEARKLGLKCQLLD